MKHEVEIELKTILTEADFYRLLGFYVPVTFKRQHNFYYQGIDRSHYAFRIRETREGKLFTLKTKAAKGRLEHEKYLDGDWKDDPEITELLAEYGFIGPFELCGDLITDRAVICDGLAELCFDINHYNGLIDYEVEYEIKKTHDHIVRFESILRQADLAYIPNKVSKYARCLKTRQ